MTLQLKGYVKEGKLHVDLPPDVPDGEVTVIVEPETTHLPTWTDAELGEMLRPDPKTGAESVALGHTGGWAHLGITDGAEWVAEQRRKRRERRKW